MSPATSNRELSTESVTLQTPLGSDAFSLQGFYYLEELGRPFEMVLELESSTLDIDFHSTILAAAQNRVARRFFENAQIISLVVSWNHFKADPAVLAKRVAPSAKQHREIYEAIKKRDSVKARKLMRAHISGMAKRVLADIGRR